MTQQLSEFTSFVKWTFLDNYRGGLDIIYEHTKVEEDKERGEAQGSLIVIGSLVSLCSYMSRS